jgi:hypothetical protein
MKKQDTKYQNAPYKENDEYVDTLVRKATENAITKGKERKGKSFATVEHPLSHNL